MPRISYVKKAQQRYETVPVLNAAGEPEQTPVYNADGTPKVSKKGRRVFRSVTRDDYDKPLPPYTCDSCGKPIEVGTPYKWIAPKSGPYGGRRLNRHEGCPAWHEWEYSSSLSARTAQLSYNFWQSLNLSEVTELSDVTDALSSLADEIRSLASEKEEAADNVEEGFGHETETSTNLRDIAEQLNSWADDVENANVPDLPELDALDEGETEEQRIEDWRAEVEGELSIVDECPV